MRVVPRRTVWLFTDKAEAVSEATASFDWREVQGVDIHGVWVVGWLRSLRTMGEIGACVLQSQSSVH